ncbi:cell wall-binding repeat-containing protein [Chryseomicrobium palamuruense]
MKRILTWLVAVLVTLAILPTMPAQTQAQSTLPPLKPLVILDPGHGGMYSGTAGYSGNRTGYYEKHANLEVSLRLRNLLQSNGYEVKMTRETDKHFATASSGQDLRARMRVANELAKDRHQNAIFISIHHNAYLPTTEGYETYYFDRTRMSSTYLADPLQIKYSAESQRLATLTHRSMIQANIHNRDRGSMHKELFVTYNAQMPAILSEIEFMSNPRREALVKTANFQQAAANALLRGVNEFFNAYQVYDMNGNVAFVSTSKAAALDFAAKTPAVRVLEKNTGEFIYDSIKLDYRAYHTSVELAQTEFLTESQAIAFASKFRNTRVVYHPTGKVVWSNYLNHKYAVQNTSKQTLDKHPYRSHAIENVDTIGKGSVVDDVTKQLVYSNYLQPGFMVKHASKGNMKAFFNLGDAKTYAQNYPSTSVVEVSSNKTLYTNPVKASYNSTSKTIKGDTRIATAVAVSKELYPQGYTSAHSQKTVILATARDYADALSAGPLAMHYGNAPILLTNAGSLSSETRAEIARLKATRVILIGGTGALSEQVEANVRALPGVQVERVAGTNRYETNDLVNNKMPKGKGNMVVAGNNYPDALSAAAVAVQQDYRIILTNGTSFRDPLIPLVRSVPTYIVGGTQAVTENLVEEFKLHTGADLVKRLSGKNRYETNLAVLEEFNKSITGDRIIVATGTNFPDALVTSALSGKHTAALVLVGNTLPSDQQARLGTFMKERVTPTTVYAGGVVPNTVKTAIERLK